MGQSQKAPAPFLRKSKTAWAFLAGGFVIGLGFLALLVVALVIFLFLLHFRAAFVAVITLPLGVLGAFIIMSGQGVTANIMSLGGIAIAIGAMVDGPIVLVENAHKHLALARSRFGDELDSSQRWAAIRTASLEVGPALFFSLLIISRPLLR